jgi:hypothetical protein
MVNVAEATHSPSAELMKLADVNHLSDFDEVVAFLTTNLDKVISEVHGFDKLLIDDGNTQLNCPPVPEAGDSHGSLLLRTLSEKEAPEHDNITLKREFKVHDCGADPEDPQKHKVEIREDVTKAPTELGQPPIMTENVRIVSIVRA